MEKRNGDLYLTLNEDFVTELKRRFYDDDDDDDNKNQEKHIFSGCKMKYLNWEIYYKHYYTSNKLIFFDVKDDEMYIEITNFWKLSFNLFEGLFFKMKISDIDKSILTLIQKKHISFYTILNEDLDLEKNIIKIRYVYDPIYLSKKLKRLFSDEVVFANC